MNKEWWKVMRKERWKTAREEFEKQTHGVTVRLSHSDFAQLAAHAKEQKISLAKAVRLFIVRGLDIESK